jgi:type IV pilus assembly protein PilC
MLFVGMVKAGESSGALDKVLFRLADHLDKEVRVRQKIKAAITYPAFIFVLAMILATIIVQHILPTFINGVFASENLALPLMTQVLILVTNFLNDGQNLTYLAAGFVVFAFFLMQYMKTPQGRFQFQSLLHNMPGSRDVVKTLLAARFCRIFSFLINSGIPLVHSLELVSAALGDYVVAPRIEQVKNDLRDGKELAESVKDMDVFPKLLVEFLIVGEETGRIAELMEKLADTYDEDIDNAVEAYTALLEPVMLCVMGGLVGYVIIAVFIPLYQLVGAI